MNTGSDGILLSVVVPCYRVEEYLPRCLDSLLAQSLKEMEIICVNDGSPDRCLPILRDYQRRWGRRIVIIDKPNEGVWKARLDGIMAASGTYTGFVDPDDYVREDYAKKLCGAAVRLDADIACCGYDRIDMTTGKRYSREMTRFPYESFDIQKDPGLLLEVNPALWNKVFRTEMIRQMPRVRHIPKALDDYVFSQLIYLDARVITFVPESLICYMIRSGSVVSTIRPGMARGLYTGAREMRRIFEEKRPAMLTYVDGAAFAHLGVSFMYRLCRESGFGRILKRNRAYLDRTFPGWRRNPYLTVSYVSAHRGAGLKLLVVRWLCRLHLFRIFIILYRFAVERTGIDVKW